MMIDQDSSKAPSSMANSSQDSDALNGENEKSISASVHVDLQEPKTNLYETHNAEFIHSKNEENFSMNDSSSSKSSTTTSSSISVEEGDVADANKPKNAAPENFIDCSKIYVSCRFCKKGFETIQNVNNHDCKKKKSDSKVKMHKCKFCSLSFSQKQHLTTHIKGHTRNNCTLCDAQFTKRKALCKHLRTVHNVKIAEKLHQCSFCDKNFSRRLSLNVHMKSHVNHKFFCLTCCFTCDDEETYIDHVKQHMKISKHECHLCEKKFVRRQQYEQHMMAHERHSCSPCNITFSSKKLFLKHQHSVHHTENEKKYQCLICKKSFARPKYLEMHQRVHTGEKPVKCSHCEKNFSDSKSLLKHMKTVKHLQRVSSQEGQKIEIEKPFLCSKCGVSFYCQQSLVRHVEIIHSTAEFLKCSHCDYKSKCKTNFKRHLELHTDVKRFVCELCGSSFRALATLKEHYVFVHSESREFICEVCKKGFKNKSTLQRHMRIHSESRPYKCLFCDRDYKRMSHLKRHIVSAHKIILKNYRTYGYNGIKMDMMKNASVNDSSLTEENVTALMKSLEALPDESSSCDSFSDPHCFMTITRSHIAIDNNIVPANHYITAVPCNYEEGLNDLRSILNVELHKEQLSTETRDDAVPLDSMQKFSNNCDVYIKTEGSKSNLNTFDVSEHLKIPPTSEASSASLDDATLSLSPSNYCNTSSSLTTFSIENLTNVSSQDVHSLTSDDNIIHPQTSPPLNFQTPTSNMDSFVPFSNSDLPSPLPVPPFSLNSSPSHVTDLEHNSSQRQLFGVSEDFLSLPSYASNNEFGADCFSEQFFKWDTDENSNNLKLPNSDLAIPSTCANIFASSLTSSVINLLPKDLFASDSIDGTTLKPEFDPLSHLC